MAPARRLGAPRAQPDPPGSDAGDRRCHRHHGRAVGHARPAQRHRALEGRGRFDHHGRPPARPARGRRLHPRRPDVRAGGLPAPRDGHRGALRRGDHLRRGRVLAHRGTAGWNGALPLRRAGARARAAPAGRADRGRAEDRRSPGAGAPSPPERGGRGAADPQRGGGGLR